VRHRANRSFLPFFAAMALVLAACVLVPARADMPVNLDARTQASYTCPKPVGAAEIRRTAEHLSQQAGDKNSLACSADLLVPLAVASPSDRTLVVVALGALSRYIDLIHTLRDFDLGKASWAEYRLRLAHAGELAAKLLPAAQRKWPNDAMTLALAAMIEGFLAGPNDPQITLAAIGKLKRAVALAPDVLHGQAQLLIGRFYLDLPPQFGGGAKLALNYLEASRRFAPENPRALRYLVEAHDELGHDQQALATLHQLAALPVDAADPQLSADEWRMGEGLATRMGDTALADRFATLRSDLMRKHPELKLRKFSAFFGHGGDDPMTGEAQYRGEQTSAH